MDLMKLCRPGDHSHDRVASRPWAVQAEGREWTGATDGGHLLFARGAHGGIPPESRIVLTKLAPFLEDLGRPHKARLHPSGAVTAEGCQRLLLPDLLEWCGPPSPFVTCPGCQGEGYALPDGDCSECKGEGGWGDEQFPGLLFGHRVDRNALGQFLAAVEAPPPECYFEQTEIVPPAHKGRDASRVLLLHGDGWCLYFMPAERWADYELADKDVTRFDAEFPLRTVWGRVD
jgi:hypothetical protein